jgi:hypothetical protein
MHTTHKRWPFQLAQEVFNEMEAKGQGNQFSNHQVMINNELLSVPV